LRGDDFSIEEWISCGVEAPGFLKENARALESILETDDWTFLPSDADGTVSLKWIYFPLKANSHFEFETLLTEEARILESLAWYFLHAHVIYTTLLNFKNLTKRSKSASASSTSSAGSDLYRTNSYIATLTLVIRLETPEE